MRFRSTLRLFVSILALSLASCDAGGSGDDIWGGDGGSGGGDGSGCCRVCTTGRACGDSCIAAGRDCDAGPGCACNG